ncbi:MAG: rhamnogalacturonan lyase B N-terminal domain-containing protein [Pseudomonadota bacterium]|nr:rhamnogalacturonan lyase B N-terminal domain-containing protein [Pseudomonadota bacterium]
MHKFSMKAMAAGCFLFSALAGLSLDAQAAFGLTTTTNDYTVDTGGGLVFKVQRVKNSKAGIGDISSLVYNGVDVQGQTKGSHIASGFSALYTGVPAVSVAAALVGTDIIKVTVQTGNLVHYYLVKKNTPHIYMGTYITDEPSVGEFRWITRLNSALITGVPNESNLTGTTLTVESTDVFGFANGQTRSKYYGNQRSLEYGLRGVTGNNIGIYMAYDSREGASGGPFYRDIQNQSSSTTSGDTELYNYMNSGHNQTEPFRMGFHGPYALLFTNGPAPVRPDMSWFDGLGLTGYVGAAGRGSVAVGGVTGRDTRFAYTVGFANATAQYWAAANPVDGHATSTGMLPGTYAMTVYKNELAVATSTVSVAAGATSAPGNIAITADPSATVALWRIGDWDGSPKEFLNADKVNAMHPSDTRMAYWTPPDFLVGSSAPATNFPAYQWKDVNGNVTVRFNLKASQIVAASVYKLRVGITAAYNGARPQIKLNSWTSTVPANSSQPASRSLTTGTYRGNNATFTYTVPVSALVLGQNILVLTPASGTAGTGYLSPGYAYDALDFVKTP